MARDYAKIQAKRTPRRSKSTKKPKRLWLILLVLVVLFIAGLFFLNNHQKSTSSETITQPLTKITEPTVKTTQPKTKNHIKIQTQTTKQQSNQDQPTKQPTQDQQNEPKFEFYTILPKEHVNVSSTDIDGTKNNTTQYLLQISSVKKYADADSLKAELALLGFEAYVDEFKDGDTNWYRINIGPYLSLKAAQQDQKKLETNNIKSILLKSRKGGVSPPTP